MDKKNEGPFRPGPFGIPRINYGWWARNLIQVEQLPPGALPYYENDMKPDKEELSLMEKEHQARLEWAAQEKLVAQIHDELLSLPLEARVKLFGQFCTFCGIDNPGCHCWNDE